VEIQVEEVYFSPDRRYLGTTGNARLSHVFLSILMFFCPTTIIKGDHPVVTRIQADACFRIKTGETLQSLETR
jgi:hypothetical protein